jgi:hypothetical protein
MLLHNERTKRCAERKHTIILRYRFHLLQRSFWCASPTARSR